jgi:Tol biopolymer transport system component
MTENGHCSYLPGNEWILNDTYPGGAHLEGEREQGLYLYQVASGTTVSLGRFHTAPEYTGEWRCDLHPRFSPDGRSVVIDSVHAGHGRQMYLLDVSEILDHVAAGH